MFSRCRALLLLAVLLWQSLAMLGPATVAQRAGAVEHLMVHVQATSHHHHADDTLHLDHADDAVQHLHADASNGTAGLLTTVGPPVVRGGPLLPWDVNHVIWHSPILDGPLRPPRPSA